MKTVEVNHVFKSYADKVAVDDLSFDLERGEIFGLIGPNGAGKTTTIRMIMNIFRPDKGTIALLGEKPSDETKNRIGYLPEERGLYQKLTVMESIVYLATLKGMDSHSAESRATELLGRTGMLPNKNKKIEEMSKGMSQIIQFIVTIVHDPEFVVLDEPFTALDPANAQLLKEMVAEMKERGQTVMISTHRMDEVEELCDRLLMVNEGRQVLYGPLTEIKERYRNDSIFLEYRGDLPEIPGIKDRIPRKGYTELTLDGTVTPQQLLGKLVGLGVTVNRFELATPSLNEIFLKVVGKDVE